MDTTQTPKTTEDLIALLAYSVGIMHDDYAAAAGTLTIAEIIAKREGVRAATPRNMFPSQDVRLAVRS